MAIELIERAATLAARGHKEQMRKHGNIPYIVHPFMVSRILTKHGFRDEVVAAGLIHDVLEDTTIPREELVGELGQEVVSIVDGLSENKSPDITWKERKQGYIEMVRKGSDDVKAVSCADKVHNMTNLLHGYAEQGDAFWAGFSKPKEEKLWFEQEVLKMYDEEGFKHSLVEEYRALVKKFEETS